MNTDGHRVIARIAGMLLMLASSGAFAATPIPPGKWSFVFADAKGRPDRPIRVYTYRPRLCDTKCPILILMHGGKRNAYDYMTHWELVADRHKFLVVAPEFRRDLWPKAAAYEAGDVLAQPDREKWAYSAIEHLFDEVRDGQPGYAIVGYSAGAQFVQRMALYRPDNRASAMVAANPGWYTMPEWRKEKTPDPYPYSMLGSPAGEAELRQGLQRRLILIAAEKDAEPDEEKLGESAGAKKQGETRLERAENFIKAAGAAAAELQVKLAWEYNEAPAGAQDAAAMSRLAADALYGKR